MQKTKCDCGFVQYVGLPNCQKCGRDVTDAPNFIGNIVAEPHDPSSYERYQGLLERLFALHDAGLSESPEFEAIQEESTDAWYALTDAQRDALAEWSEAQWVKRDATT